MPALVEGIGSKELQKEAIKSVIQQYRLRILQLEAELELLDKAE